MRLLNLINHTFMSHSHDVSILVLVDAPLECMKFDIIRAVEISFNPCFSGCASWINTHTIPPAIHYAVSILVLVDAPLEWDSFLSYSIWQRVSILVLVDAPLESKSKLPPSFKGWSFNPCFSGCASWMYRRSLKLLAVPEVSILVLVDAPLEWVVIIVLWHWLLVSILVLVDAPLE